MENNDLDQCRQLEESIEYYLGHISTQSKVIYISLVAICFLALVSMALIKIRISITIYGIFRPEAEKTLLHSPVPGKADMIFVSEGQAIHAGDTLLVMDSHHLLHSLRECRARKGVVTIKLNDIKNILSGQTEALVSAELSSGYQQFSDGYQAILIRYDKAARERERHERLFLDSLISEKEYDDLANTEMILHNEMAVKASAYHSGLEALSERLTLEYRDLLLQEENLLLEIRNNHLIAPVSGHIEEFSGIYEGSNITANQMLFTISPDTSLIAEMYLPPSKAGYVFAGQEVRILVDSYNYREWGSLNTIVRDISSDVLLINNTPFFRIKCDVTDNTLRLKNGSTGRLKQGMTFRARLFLNSRTLMQILFDRLEKWMTPVP